MMDWYERTRRALKDHLRLRYCALRLHRTVELARKASPDGSLSIFLDELACLIAASHNRQPILARPAIQVQPPLYLIDITGEPNPLHLGVTWVAEHSRSRTVRAA